jgi:hypothetical protein
MMSSQLLMTVVPIRKIDIIEPTQLQATAAITNH